jgi:hypothetical protein
MSLSLIKSLMTETVEIVRARDFTLVEGRYQRGSETTKTASASVQPLNPDEQQLLPEGRRSKESVKFYLAERVYGTDEENQLPADRIRHDGKLFEVVSVANWAIGTDLPHYKAIAVKLDGEGGGDGQR